MTLVLRKAHQRHDPTKWRKLLETKPRSDSEHSLKGGCVDKLQHYEILNLLCVRFTSKCTPSFGLLPLESGATFAGQPEWHFQQIIHNVRRLVLHWAFFMLDHSETLKQSVTFSRNSSWITRLLLHELHQFMQTALSINELQEGHVITSARRMKGHDMQRYLGVLSIRQTLLLPRFTSYDKYIPNL